MTFDLGVLEGQLGDPGRLQMIVYLLLATVYFSVSCNMVVGVFFVYTPRFSCHAHLDVNQQSNITGRKSKKYWTFKEKISIGANLI